MRHLEQRILAPRLPAAPAPRAAGKDRGPVPTSAEAARNFAKEGVKGGGQGLRSRTTSWDQTRTHRLHTLSVPRQTAGEALPR